MLIITKGSVQYWQAKQQQEEEKEKNGMHNWSNDGSKEEGKADQENDGK